MQRRDFLRLAAFTLAGGGVSLRALLGLASGSGSTAILANPLAHATLTRYGDPVLTRGTAGAWDADTVAGEQVFWDTRLERWVMVYSALAEPIASGGVGRIGIAYSNNLLDWEKDAANPVFAPNATEGHVATGNIIQLADETYRLYYQSYQGSLSDRIYAAESDDLVTWTRLNGGTAVLAPGTSGQWDDEVVFDPAPMLIGTDTYLWYGGQKASDDSRGIGLATSSDGVSFTRQGRLFTPAAGEASRSYGAPALLVTSATDYMVFHDAALTSADTTRFICRQDTSNGSTFAHNHQILTAGGSWDTVQVFDPSPVVHNGVLYLFYCGSASTGSGTELAPDIGLATMAWP